MEWLFSWEVASWFVGGFIAAALAFVALSDFKLAKLFFLLAAADAMGGIAMWGAKSEFPRWFSTISVVSLCGAIGFLLLLSMRYVHSKRDVKNGTLVCEVQTVQFEPFYRFYQFPPVYFQRLDTAIRISLTNGVGRPVYIRSCSVAALVGTEWVQFKNADSAAFEPYAFGVMGIGSNKAYLGRFDLSANGFDYVVQQRPLNPDENLELWIFFISGLSRKDQPGISQFKFVFRDSTRKDFYCIAVYSVKEDRGTVLGFNRGNIKVMPIELIPPNIREEPLH